MKAQVVLREAKPARDSAKPRQNWFSASEILECRPSACAGQGWGQLLLLLIFLSLLGHGGFTSREVPGSCQVALEGSSTEQRLPGTVGMEELAPPGTHLEPPWVSGDHSRATKTTVGPPVVKLGPTQGQLRKPGLFQCQRCLCWDHL